MGRDLVERPDWGPGGEHRSVVPVDEALPAAWEGNRQAEGNADSLSGLSPAQISLAEEVAIELLNTAPDAKGLMEAVDEMSPGLQRKVFTTMAADPHFGDSIWSIELNGL